MSKGGIAIRDFERIAVEPEVQKGFSVACGIFKSRINDDDDARRACGLENLNSFIGKPRKFIAKVVAAVTYVENRQRGKMLAKVGRDEGITLIYDDGDNFVVSPDDCNSSKKAAYLDNGTAPWCVAAPPQSARKRWDTYWVHSVFYVYHKGRNGDADDSWCLVSSDYDAHCAKRGFRKRGPLFTLIENRANNVGEDDEKIANAYTEMLVKTGIDSVKLSNAMHAHLYGSEVPVNHTRAVIQAIEEGDNTTLRELYDKSELQSWRNINGMNALVCCMKKDNIEGFDFLLEKGFDWKVEHKWLHSGLLHEAAENDALNCARRLLQLGADPNANSHLNRRVIHSAAFSASPEFIEMLLDAGADINARDTFGWTPLYCASIYLRVPSALCLLRRGASVATRWNDRANPIVLLAQCGDGYATLVDELLRRGLNATGPRDDKGRSALEIANEGGFDELMKVFAKYGWACQSHGKVVLP